MVGPVVEEGAPTGGGAGARRPRLVALFQAVLLAAAALAWFSQSLDRTLNLRDEGYLLRMASRVAAGEMPHRDFVEAYGPGVFAAPALALELGDRRILAVRWLLAALRAGAVLLSFVLLRRLVPTALAWLGAGLAILWWGRASINLNTPHASLFTIPICLLALWLLLRAFAKGTARDYFAAGVAAGAAVLFKQSLGVMNACGLVIAIWAVAMLGGSPARETAPSRRAPRETLAGITIFAALGLLVLVPASAFLSWRDYLLHFLPLHAFMALVALATARGGMAEAPTAILRQRVLPFAAGAGLVLSALVLVYAAWGALPALVQDMFVLPLRLRNYYLPAGLPPAGITSFAAGALLILAGGLCWAAGRARSGLALASAGVIAMTTAVLWLPRSNPDLYTPAVLWRTATVFDWVLPSALVVAATCLLAAPLLRPNNGEHRDALHGAVALVLFQSLLAFQIFPRAGHNVWLAQGAYVPLLVVVLHRAYRLAVAGDPPPGRRLTAGLMLACLPIWLVAPVVATVLAPPPAEALRHSLDLPETRGISLSLKQIDEESLADFQSLIAHLGRSEPKDARLLLFSNEHMIYFLSQREPLLPEREFLFFSAASGMLPLRELATLGDDRLISELIRRPETLVVQHRDASGARLRRALPRADTWLSEHYAVEAEIGVYQVLRSRSFVEEGRPESQKPKP